MNLWHDVEISIQSLLDTTQKKCNGLFTWYSIFFCCGAHFVFLSSWRGKVHTKSNLCLNCIIYMVHRPFLLFVMLPAGVKDPVSDIHHDSAHKRLFSELSCTVQIQRLLPFSEPKLSHNKESTAFFHQALPKSLHLALKMIIWQKIA